MPSRGDLPESLASLARRNALLIRHESFRYDAGRLVTAIERVLAATSGDAAVLSASEVRSARSAGSVISEVAQQDPGSTRDDPDRAARLFTDAERIANSITDESLKALALSSVAEALAAADPYRAERIANSISDEPWEASPLSSVAEAMAATDPYRAERITSFISERSRASALSSVARAIAATDPDRAAWLFTRAKQRRSPTIGCDVFQPTYVPPDVPL